jgi:hypothetical protein
MRKGRLENGSLYYPDFLEGGPHQKLNGIDD